MLALLQPAWRVTSCGASAALVPSRSSHTPQTRGSLYGHRQFPDPRIPSKIHAVAATCHITALGQITGCSPVGAGSYPGNPALGVSLEQCRQALDSLDREALESLGLTASLEAPPLAMRRIPARPTCELFSRIGCR
jgi:hypothetical protein